MLITFEGIDGSGKSTQIDLLKKTLEAKGHRVTVFREPGGTEVSERIRDLLLNPELDIDPVTEVLLFSSARSQLIAEKVTPLLNDDQIVILDRFYDSTTAYQGYGRESMPLVQIQQINDIASHGIVPDITFYLRLTLDESGRRTAHMYKDRMEQSGDSFFKKVFEGFEQMAKTEKRFCTIDASLDVEQVHQQILQKLKAFLPL